MWGTNTAGQVEDEDMQLYQQIDNEIPIASTVSAAGPVEFEDTPILESPEVEIPTIYTRKPSKKSRKRRRTVDEQDDSVELLKAADLLPLQQVDEEQRDYYRFKRQRLLKKSL